MDDRFVAQHVMGTVVPTECNPNLLHPPNQSLFQVFIEFVIHFNEMSIELMV